MGRTKKPAPKTPAKKRRPRIIDRKPAFLAAFEETCNLTEAAKAAGIDRGTHYDWLEQDDDYKERFERARARAAGGLVDDAVEWARRGIFEPLVYQGHFCYAQREVKLYQLPDGREVRKEQLAPAMWDARRDAPIADLKVEGVRTIWENYGPPLGIYRRSENLLNRLLTAYVDEFKPKPAGEFNPDEAGDDATITVEYVRPPKQ